MKDYTATTFLTVGPARTGSRVRREKRGSREQSERALERRVERLFRWRKSGSHTRL